MSDFGYTFDLSTDWDLHVDAAGNFATITDGAAIAQNVANAVRLFTNDAYFDSARGIPHFSLALGIKPLTSMLRQRLIAAAQAVDGVQSADIENMDIDKHRNLTATIVLTLTNGATYNVEI